MGVQIAELGDDAAVVASRGAIAAASTAAAAVDDVDGLVTPRAGI